MWLIPRRWAHTLPGEWARIAAACRANVRQDPDALPRFEEAVARFVGMPHAAAISSGRMGMRLIFEHLGLREGDEVIVPAYTLAALIPLLERTGARAVFADISPDTLNVTPDSVAARLSPRTKAILVLHTFGAPAPVDEIAALAETRGVPLIEDCAHSLGATLHGRQTGSFGHAAFYSFEPTKPINTYGGGMVLSRDAALVERVRAWNAQQRMDTAVFAAKTAAVRTEQRLLRSGVALPLLAALALPQCRPIIEAMYRSRQTIPPTDLGYLPVQAALGLEKLKGLPDRLRTRTENAARLIAMLDPAIRPQISLPGAQSTWYFFAVQTRRPANALRARLLWRGVDAAVEEEVADDCATPRGVHDCPNAARAFRHTIALPFFDDMPPALLGRIARAINRIAP